MLIAAEPQLFVRDIGRSIDHYTVALGFEVAFQYGEPLFYAQVRRDGARLNLRHSDRTPYDAAFAADEGEVLVATIAVDEIERLFEELTATGAVFHQKLHTEPWGAQTFIVRDPDDNLICFAG